MIDEEEYFQIIEQYFLQKRGNPMLLSPKEWALIREWYEASVPQEVVLRAIDLAFERKKDEEESPVSLRYCKRIVKAEHKKFLKSLEGKTEGVAKNVFPESASIRDFLIRLSEALQTSGRLAASQGNRPLSELLEKKGELIRTEVLSYFDSNPGELQRVEEKLTALEKEIEELLLGTISEEQMKNLKEDSMRELKSFEKKLDFPVFQEMLRRSLIKSIRRIYNIPRLSLFYM